MKKHLLKHRSLEILLQIHRGFLTKEQSQKMGDQEVLSNVPPNKGTYKLHKDDETRENRVSPFTYRWVRQAVKANNKVTAFELLVSSGFEAQANSLGK